MKPIISAAELAQHIDQHDWTIIDCRFNLAQPEWGFQDYQNGHLPHAIYAHLNNDLSSKPSLTSGRHPLPDPHEFVNKLSAWGIDEKKKVVVYDTVGGSYAVRLWWLLRFYGHQEVAVLDGGFQAWLEHSFPTSTDIEIPNPAKFIGFQKNGWIVTTEEMEKVINNPEYQIIDARSPERYLGEVEPIDPIAGHIPGAINRFHQLNLGTDGKFKSPEILRKEFLELLGGTNSDHAIVYCGSGVTSLHHNLALEIAGLPPALIYIGSWSEWIRDPNHPIAAKD